MNVHRTNKMWVEVYEKSVFTTVHQAIQSSSHSYSKWASSFPVILAHRKCVWKMFAHLKLQSIREMLLIKVSQGSPLVNARVHIFWLWNVLVNTRDIHLFGYEMLLSMQEVYVFWLWVFTLLGISGCHFILHCLCICFKYTSLSLPDTWNGVPCEITSHLNIILKSSLFLLHEKAKMEKHLCVWVTCPPKDERPFE